MYGKLLFIVGAGVGYVFGTRAGRDRYESLKAQADTLWHDPRVQDKVQQASTVVKEKAPEVTTKLAGATGAVKEKVGMGGGAQPRNDDLLIGSEPGSNYTPEETKFTTSGE